MVVPWTIVLESSPATTNPFYGVDIEACYEKPCQHNNKIRAFELTCETTLTTRDFISITATSSTSVLPDRVCATDYKYFKTEHLVKSLHISISILRHHGNTYAEATSCYR